MGHMASPLEGLWLRFANHYPVPQLAFGLYEIPDSEDGESMIQSAVDVGYRHFDSASFYRNETTLGSALRKTTVPRNELFLATKVWKDAVKSGPNAVRDAVLQSIADINYGEYMDLVLIHWPVPGYFVQAYKELEDLHRQGKIRSLGLSNFTPAEYEELVASGISIFPVVNQFEVSPFMYRKDWVDYFKSKGILVTSSKSLHRGKGFVDPDITRLSQKYSVSPAQLFLRWGVEKGLIVAAKSSNPARMKENISVTHFSIAPEDIATLDGLTTEAAVCERIAHEQKSKEI
jgi:diketogulonate reductase-like aldo/keto reductase